MLVMSQHSFSLAFLVLVFLSILNVEGRVVPVLSGINMIRRGSDPDASYELNSDEDGDDTKDGITPPPSDRVLRSALYPLRDWIVSGEKGSETWWNHHDDDFTDAYDKFDNGASGNCELCKGPNFELDPSAPVDEEDGEGPEPPASPTPSDGEDEEPEHSSERRAENEPRDHWEWNLRVLARRIDGCADNWGTRPQTVDFRLQSDDQKSIPTAHDGLAGRSPEKLSCDEFPFASTKEARTVPKTATRCVPAIQNSRQGGKIAGLYRSILTSASDDFEIWFDYGKGPQTSTQGPKTFKYCVTAATSTSSICKNRDPMQMS
ncbi:hypothetical protein DFH07DRAFT_772237 [Mycena maculata]|uniref:Deoxyribonuclease NucA/NucB domain-containing protein n=1 Tax=Mycena maculata TaxID=230809 RepID=A0AAD7JB55_9AGAR|nr:hypothetical protein DFH07DRAFT_772237 [Mycena maculata]